MKGIEKKKLGVLIVGIVLSAVTLMTSIFAWFANTRVDHPIIFTTGNIDVTATLYKADNVNISEPVPNSSYQLVTGPVVIDNLVSGDVYRFKLVVKNTGNIPGNLTITLMNLPNITIKDTIRLKYSDLNGTTYTHTQETFPINNFIIGTQASLSPQSGLNEVILYFQIEVKTNLTNAHYGQSLVIDHIEIKLEQIPPSP
ncbi:MAG: hypothetical protein GX232_03825 [Acholeplasmataceae bacterium]|jgi:hypothetical protein|nr:hypothetical protein [Acholeplasmataceae bacterium]